MLAFFGSPGSSNGVTLSTYWDGVLVNTVDYIATDRKRLVIPWIRVTDQSGKVTVYRTEDGKTRLAGTQETSLPVRRMDCLDCHNRPTHQYRSPNELLDLALSNGRIDSSIPSIKAAGAKLLAGTYTNEAQALATIDRDLRAKYPDDARVVSAIRELQADYSANFFPEMKVRWNEYPNHIGHRISPGCFRCHDGKHVSDSGRRISNDCNACHTILAQGAGKDLKTFTSSGLAFEHPEDVGDDWKTERCDTCHTGSP